MTPDRLHTWLVGIALCLAAIVLGLTIAALIGVTIWIWRAALG